MQDDEIDRSSRSSANSSPQPDNRIQMEIDIGNSPPPFQRIGIEHLIREFNGRVVPPGTFQADFGYTNLPFPGVPSNIYLRRESMAENEGKLDYEFRNNGPIKEGRMEAPLNFTSFFLNPSLYDPRSEILQSVNDEGDTALFVASKAGHKDAVLALLSAPETQVNWRNHKGITSLSAASHKGRTEIVKILIKAGADVNAESYNGSTPLIQSSHFGHIEVVVNLVKAGAIVDKPNNKGTTALMRATQEGKEEVVEFLIQKGADVNRRNNERMNALMLGSQRGHAQIVRILISHFAEVDEQTAQGSTALMLACKRGHAEVVQALLTAGAEIFIKDTRGKTAHNTAARRWYHEILENLSPAKQMFFMQSKAREERRKVLHYLYQKNHLIMVSSRNVLHFGRIHNQSMCRSVYSLRNDSCIENNTRFSSAALYGSRFYPYRRGNAGGERRMRGLWGEDRAAMIVLKRCLYLPKSLYERIVEFIPMPRLWEDNLSRLRKRCYIDANESVKGALQLIDEVFTDLCINKIYRGHLVEIGRSDAMREMLVGSDYKMPSNLISLLCTWSDIQSINMRLEWGINYEPAVAVQVVQLAGEVCLWYRCRESQRCYVLDPIASNLLSHIVSGGMNANRFGSNGGAEGGNQMDEAAHFESGSSDGEMDA
mmetsp:Transcript_7720/g.11628  ORF Transcript_7720/g.11628 Transcript_7720/m.11628 type:complete len:655 (+) Transcript_7720:109-2073(+)